MSGKRKSISIAVISDIHGNNDALKAALEDIDNRNISRIVCLGDIIGYGGQPKAVVRTIMKRKIVSCFGNHEELLKLVEKSKNKKGVARLKAGGLHGLGINLPAARSITITNEILTAEPELLSFLIGTKDGKFKDGLRREIGIAPGVKGCHSLLDEKGEMRYFMSGKRAKEYGINNTDLFKNPLEILQTQGTFDKKTSTWFLGHTHVPIGYFFQQIPGGKLKPYEHLPNREAFPNPDGTMDSKFMEIGIGGYLGIINGGSIGISRREDYELTLAAREGRVRDKPGKKGNRLDILPAYYAIYNPKRKSVEFVEFYYDASKVKQATLDTFGEVNMFTMREKKYAKR